MVEFYQKKGIYMLKLGCTFSNLVNICLHKHTSASFHAVAESVENLLSIVREDMVGGPSIVFTRKTVVDETHIYISTNVCKSNFGKGAGQIKSYSRCQPMTTWFYTKYNFDAAIQKQNPRQNKSRSIETMVMSNLERMRPECRIESFYTTAIHEKIYCFNADAFFGHWNTEFEAMGCFYEYCFC